MYLEVYIEWSNTKSASCDLLVSYDNSRVIGARTCRSRYDILVTRWDL